MTSKKSVQKKKDRERRLRKEKNIAKAKTAMENSPRAMIAKFVSDVTIMAQQKAQLELYVTNKINIVGKMREEKPEIFGNITAEDFEKVKGEFANIDAIIKTLLTITGEIETKEDTISKLLIVNDHLVELGNLQYALAEIMQRIAEIDRKFASTASAANKEFLVNEIKGEESVDFEPMDETIETKEEPAMSQTEEMEKRMSDIEIPLTESEAKEIIEQQTITPETNS